MTFILHVQSLSLTHQEKNVCWTQSPLAPFNELLISWNAKRPMQGHYVILCRLLIQDQWSPWLLYAVWGDTHQYSFHDTTSQAPVQSFQDQVEVLEGTRATGFSIRVEAYGGATLEEFYTLFACASELSSHPLPWSLPSIPQISLSVPRISQLCLTHPRSQSFCSPTSTTAVIRYLSKTQLQPLQFAKQVYDAGFDIYGHWPFNVAQAFVELGHAWQCFCVRLPHIEWIWESLQLGCPVVISVKGNLPGANLPYTNGHLIVIKGYDVNTQQFLCVDPAFPSDEETEIAYPWRELLEAWGRRYYLSYFFLPKETFFSPLKIRKNASLISSSSQTTFTP
jgi:hypothetical protein